MKIVGMIEGNDKVLQHDHKKKIRIVIEGYVENLYNTERRMFCSGPDGSRHELMAGDTGVLEIEFSQEEVRVETVE